MARSTNRTPRWGGKDFGMARSTNRTPRWGGKDFGIARSTNRTPRWRKRFRDSPFYKQNAPLGRKKFCLMIYSLITPSFYFQKSHFKVSETQVLLFQSWKANSPQRRRCHREIAERRDEQSNGRRGENSLFLLLFSAFSQRSLRLCGELVVLTVFAWDQETTDNEEL